MDDSSEEKDFMMPREVAEAFRVAPKTVTRWAKNGRLPHTRTLGGHYRFPRAEIMALLDNDGKADTS